MTSRSDKWMLTLVWDDARPYVVMIFADLIISAVLWASFWLFHALTSLLKITGFAARLIEAIHGAGAVIAFGLFIGLFIAQAYRHMTQEESE